MVSSKAKTVAGHLGDLPAERRAVVAQVREPVRANLPRGYVEPGGAEEQLSLYLMGVYADGEQDRALRQAFAAIGKKPDIGKSCVRFMPLDATGRLMPACRSTAASAGYEGNRGGR